MFENLPLTHIVKNHPKTVNNVEIMNFEIQNENLLSKSTTEWPQNELLISAGTLLQQNIVKSTMVHVNVFIYTLKCYFLDVIHAWIRQTLLSKAIYIGFKLYMFSFLIHAFTGNRTYESYHKIQPPLVDHDVSQLNWVLVKSLTWSD